MALEEHNPDSNCIMCCSTLERLNNLLDNLEGLLAKVNDTKALDNMPPMLKVVMKMVGK